MATAYIEIPLRSRKYPGHVALVDVDDYAEAAAHNWNPLRTRTAGVARQRVDLPGGDALVLADSR
jgi:hypothetical protein